MTEHALNFVFHAYVSGQIPASQGTGSGVASFGNGHLESARVWFSLRPKQTTLMGKRPVKKRKGLLVLTVDFNRKYYHIHFVFS